VLSSDATLESELNILRKQNLEYQKRILAQEKKSEAYLEELKAKDIQIEFLSKQLIVLKKFKYGRSSEKISWAQLGFFNEAEAELAAAMASENISTNTIDSPTVKKRGTPKRRPIPENLPRREVVIELRDEDGLCPNDGSRLKEIGREASEKLNIIPATIEVVRTIRIKYGCSTCESVVKTAPVPEHILPKCLADIGLLALILVSKFVDALPLYRIEKILTRIGAEIPRCTMASWVVELGRKFTILTNLLRDELLESDYICADETPVLVLDNIGKAHDPPEAFKAQGSEKFKSAPKQPPKKGYMWVYARPGPDPIVLYDYQPGRDKGAPKGIL